MSLDEEIQLQQMASTIEKSLGFDDLAGRLALSSLVCAFVSSTAQLDRVTRELAELRAARPQLVLMNGGKP